MPSFSRRQFLKSSSVVLGALPILSACTPATTPTPAPTASKAGEKPSAPAAGQPAAGATPAPAAAKPAPAGKVTEIVYWHGWSGRFADWLTRVGQEFQKANPDVTVKFVQIDWGELYPKLLTAVAAGSPPDTYVAGNESGQLYSLAANEVITPIEDIADRNDLAKLKEVVHPSIWEIGTYNGKLWALPKWTQSYALYVNTEHLTEAGIDPDQPPATMEDLNVIAEKLFKRDNDGTIRRLGFDPGNWYFPYWGRHKAQYVDSNGNPTATHDSNVACVNWMCEYSTKYDAKKVADFRQAIRGSDAQDPFISEMISIHQTGPWHTGSIYEFKRDMPYKVWRLPRPASVQGYGMSTGGDIPVIPKGVKNPEISFKWARYLIGVDNPEVYATLWTIGLRPHMPISETVTRGPAFKKAFEMFPGFDVFVDDFFGADWWAPPSKMPVAEFYADRLNANVEKARLLQVTPAQALDATQKEVTDELQKWLAAHKK